MSSRLVVLVYYTTDETRKNTAKLREKGKFKKQDQELVQMAKFTIDHPDQPPDRAYLERVRDECVEAAKKNALASGQTGFQMQNLTISTEIPDDGSEK